MGFVMHESRVDDFEVSCGCQGPSPPIYVMGIQKLSESATLQDYVSFLWLKASTLKEENLEIIETLFPSLHSPPLHAQEKFHIIARLQVSTVSDISPVHVDPEMSTSLCCHASMQKSNKKHSIISPSLYPEHQPFAPTNLWNT